MDAKRQTDELASRCVALVIFHEHVRKTRTIRAETLAEIRAVAAEARRDRISWATISAEVLAELNARYDAKTARQLHGEFIADFDADLQLALVLV
jgi:hypothetical protein